MIKVGDTTINKVQKIDGESSIEIPIIQQSDNSLIHLGYNTYATVFENAEIQKIIDDGYYSFVKYDKNTNYTLNASSIIKIWNYCDSFDATSGAAEKIVKLRMIPSAPYEYAAGSYTSELISELKYSVSISGSQPVVTREWSIYRGSTKVVTYKDKEIAPLASRWGCMTSIYINDNMIPASYTAFLTDNSTVSYGTTEQFGTLPINSTNAPLTVSVSASGANSSQIYSRVEVASYKPADFSSSYPNYFLRSPNAAATLPIFGSSKEGQITLTPFFSTTSPTDISSGGAVIPQKPGGDPSIEIN